VTRYACSAPSSATATAAVSSKSATTTSTPAGSLLRSASVRTMARTGAPRSASASTVARPLFPVAPVTRIGPACKRLGVSGPALYRYFASRDDLLTELVIDAYHDLANALTAATSRLPNDNPRGRFGALARAYRRWALAEPHRYRLLFGPPLPGYEAHAQRLVEASRAAMNLLLEVLRGFAADVAEPAEPLGSELTAWARQHDARIDAATALHAVLIWSQLHGIVSLEIAGNFASMSIDADQLFEAQLAAITATLAG
jgi:AcrR family transcriptional regulator